MANPLFTAFTREATDLARREFASGSLAKLAEAYHASQAAKKGIGRGSSRMRQAMKTFAAKGADEALKAMSGTPFGQVVREVAKYSRSGGVTQQILQEFLDQLGPVGKLFQALGNASGGSAAGLRREVNLAKELIRAVGGEALIPRDLGTTSDWQRGLEAARKHLENNGYQVFEPGEAPSRRPGPPAAVAAKQERTKPNRTTVDVPMAAGGTKRFPKDHPIVTGAMIETPQSSNVYAYGYDLDIWALYVRFKDGTADYLGKKRQQPGSLYLYRNVEPETFLELHKASSKGGWVWDVLRIRGTVSGHNYDYALVGIQNGYVPRKATMTAQGEAYKPRTIRTDQGRGPKSQLGYELVRPWTPNRGAPSSPNRGKPNDGRPR